MPERTAVYRLFDAHDVLLYVGATSRPAFRWKEHALDRRWWPQVVRRELQWHDDRPSALAAEAAAIRCEAPLYNAVVPHPDGSLRGSTVRRTPEIARCHAAPGYRRFRLDDDLWERLEVAAKKADPDSNRSAVLRKLARWFVGDIDELPKRPDPKRSDR